MAPYIKVYHHRAVSFGPGVSQESYDSINLAITSKPLRIVLWVQNGRERIRTTSREIFLYLLRLPFHVLRKTS